jgi:hypothetical protein
MALIFIRIMLKSPSKNTKFLHDFPPQTIHKYLLKTKIQKSPQKYRRTPYLVPGNTCFKNLKIFLRVIPGIKCSQKNFEKFFRSKKKGIWTGTNTPKKLFLNFFLRFLGDFVPVPNAKKWYFSDLVPVLP